jgi:MFS family permease
LAVSFEGYAQGVLGGVNSSPDFIRTMDLSNVQDYYSPQYASDTKTIKLGGVTAVYYFGALWGAILAGWIADKLGRRTGLQLGCLWCILGTALEAGAQNTNM